jgi:hypothetical protein
MLTVDDDQLIIRKIDSYSEVLNRPAKVKISYQAWKKLNEDLIEDSDL